MTWLPILFYAAMLALIALPLAAVSRVAGVVCLVFAIAFVMSNGIGADQVWVYFWLHMLAFWATILSTRTPAGILESAAFCPMTIVDSTCLLGIITEYRWAWSIYFAAMFQLAMLAGFATSYPVNWWLLRWGLKEAM